MGKKAKKKKDWILWGNQFQGKENEILTFADSGHFIMFHDDSSNNEPSDALDRNSGTSSSDPKEHES